MEILNHTLCETGNEDGRFPGFSEMLEHSCTKGNRIVVAGMKASYNLGRVLCARAEGCVSG